MLASFARNLTLVVSVEDGSTVAIVWKTLKVAIRKVQPGAVVKVPLINA
jgi:ABC-type tungstate transport system substrate-binding protein